MNDGHLLLDLWRILQGTLEASSRQLMNGERVNIQYVENLFGSFIPFAGEGAS